LLTLASSAGATNVVFILADDLGYMDVGFNNPDTFYDTPVLNELARESMNFTQAYAACSVCSPTRASIMTGQYPARTRNTDYSGAPNGRAVMPEDPTDMKGGNFKWHARRPILPAPSFGTIRTGAIAVEYPTALFATATGNSSAVTGSRNRNSSTSPAIPVNATTSPPASPPSLRR